MLGETKLRTQTHDQLRSLLHPRAHGASATVWCSQEAPPRSVDGQLSDRQHVFLRCRVQQQCAVRSVSRWPAGRLISPFGKRTYQASRPTRAWPRSCSGCRSRVREHAVTAPARASAASAARWRCQISDGCAEKSKRVAQNELAGQLSQLLAAEPELLARVRARAALASCLTRSGARTQHLNAARDIQVRIDDDELHFLHDFFLSCRGRTAYSMCVPPAAR